MSKSMHLFYPLNINFLINTIYIEKYYKSIWKIKKTKL